jgi:hypothetical protein
MAFRQWVIAGIRQRQRFRYLAVEGSGKSVTR